MLVLGAGPGGYSAAFRAADLGMKMVLVERYATLGGVCLNVGCIPSKALLHVAAVMDEVSHFESLGVSFGKPTIDLRQAAGAQGQGGGQAHRRPGGHGQDAQGDRRARHRRLPRPAPPAGARKPRAPAQETTGKKQIDQFKNCIIAAGSQAVRLPFMPKDPRVVDSTGALELASEPKRMLILGGGIIGLEMGTVYSTLGARLDVVEMLDGLMQGADRDLVRVWQKMNTPRFDNIMLKTKTVGAEATKDGILVQLRRRAGAQGAAALRPGAAGRGPQPQRQEDRRRQGRRRPSPTAASSRWTSRCAPTCRTSSPSATSSASPCWRTRRCTRRTWRPKSAARREESAFNARVIPSVAYTDPEVAWVGLTEDQAKAEGIAIKKGHFPWTASGRAIANTRDEGFTKLLFDAQTHRILGGGIVGTHAGDMIGEVALAIEMGADEVDIGKTIHPHPTLGESIGMAAEIAHGTCTDVPPPAQVALRLTGWEPAVAAAAGSIGVGALALQYAACAVEAPLPVALRPCLRPAPGRRAWANG